MSKSQWLSDSKNLSINWFFVLGDSGELNFFNLEVCVCVCLKKIKQKFSQNDSLVDQELSVSGGSGPSREDRFQDAKTRQGFLFLGGKHRGSRWRFWWMEIWRGSSYILNTFETRNWLVSSEISVEILAKRTSSCECCSSLRRVSSFHRLTQGSCNRSLGLLRDIFLS